MKSRPVMRGGVKMVTAGEVGGVGGGGGGGSGSGGLRCDDVNARRAAEQ